MHTPSPASREVIVRNPASGEEISRHREIDAAALGDAIQRARAAQPAWNAAGLAARIRHVNAMRAWLVSHADDVAATISACTGKTRLEALAHDVTPSVFGSAWYCRHAARFLRPERIRGGNLLLAYKRSRLFRKPMGVIGIISPWNYPLGIPMHEIVPALLAGNTVVFKTAPETIPVGILIEDMCRAANLPDDVFRHVIVDGPRCGDVMLDEGGVDKLFFTGSVRVGKLLAARAAHRLVPVSLELGGKDAMIVLDDADIERAANGATWGGMQNAGQACAGIERIYVQRSIQERFLAALNERMTNLRVLGPAKDDSDVGVLTTARQADTVRAHLDDALNQGAMIAASARSTIVSEQLVLPTVLVGVNHAMRIMREETFGPVVGVMPFDTDAEAVMLANDSPYGLTASVWSRNAKRAEALALRIETGTVTINDHLVSHGMTETPWGGPKESGNGRGHGRYAFAAVTQPQVVIRDRLGFLPRNPWWFPYSRQDYLAMRGAIVALHGTGARRRLAALWQFVTGLGKVFRRG